MNMTCIQHKGYEQFKKGTFGGGGDNLFVDSNGVIRRIMDNDLNGDGIFDIVLPNSHGYIERAPTYVYTLGKNDKNDKDDKDDKDYKDDVVVIANNDNNSRKVNGGSTAGCDKCNWKRAELPHDSCWMPKVADVDGDGYLDLIIANGENGVSSELKSYIYWGGHDGLTGEYTVFDTIGAYDAAVCDLSGNGLLDVIFTTAWYDHHNEGVPLYQKVFVQTSPRQFREAAGEYRISGLATTSLVCEDLNNDGYPEIVLANYRKGFTYDTDSFLYMGNAGGFDTENPVCLPTHYALKVLAADLNGDGFRELVFSGGNQIMIYWNERGIFKADNVEVLDINGTNSQFSFGMLPFDIADIDGDGIPELVIGTIEGVEIRKANNLRDTWQKLPCYSVTGIKAVDIRNCGRMDIITSHYCSTKTYDAESLVFWNTENGYSTDCVTAFETHGPIGCTAADLDNDGIMEIIYCNTMRGPSQYDPEFPVFAYFGTPEHKYLPENRRDYPVNMMCHSYIAADVNNDGYVELVATSSDGIRIFKGTQDGPDPADYYDIIHTPGQIAGIGGVLAGDFNRDGWLDLIMAPWVYGNSEKELENSVFVYWGGPDGYSNSRRTALPSYVSSAQTIFIADINNDGYADFLYGDKEGFIGVYYGGPEGFSRERFGRINLKNYNGAIIVGISAADIDNDGWLELFVTTGGHYTRLSSHIYVLKDGRNNYPENKQIIFETGGTTGFPELADLTGTGRLDLLLPFYSTHLSRELPARIFHGDGKGSFDWENPVTIDCLASIAFCPVDLSRNGYPDLFICCHRNDLGHIVNSKLIMNGPDGLDIENAQDILGYGPHCFALKNQGNIYDRSDKEYYTSPVFECGNAETIRLTWEGETPFNTSLSFRVRFGCSEEETLKAKWSESITQNGSVMDKDTNSCFKYMQYQVEFHAPGLVNSPKLTGVMFECGGSC